MIEILKDEQYRKTLHAGIREAKKDILIMTYACNYRGTPGSRYLNAIMQELRRAQERGVKVWMLLNYEGPHSSVGMTNRKTARNLKKTGIKIKQTPPNRTFHAKMVVIDSAFIWIGSHNLAEASLSRNFEISVLIVDEKTGKKLRDIFLEIWYR